MTIRTIGLVIGILLAYNPLFGVGKEKLKPIFDIDTSVAKASSEDPLSTFLAQGVVHNDSAGLRSGVPHYYIKEEYGPIARILTITPAGEPLMSFVYKPKEGSHVDVSYYPGIKEYTGYLSSPGKSLMTATLPAKKAQEKYAELEKVFTAAKAEQLPSELDELIPKAKEILQKLKAQKDTTAATGSSK